MKNSMANLGVIEETDQYRIFQAKYKDTIQLFRQWIDSGLVEIKFTHDFARANGYKSIGNMLRNEPEIRFNLNMYCGGIPEWIQIIDGKFCVKTNISTN